MNRIHKFQQDKIKDLESLLSSLFDNKKFGFVYISIGSKYNSEYVIKNNSCIYSNAFLQMIPTFIYNNNYNNINKLIIIIDTFKDDDNQTENIRILEERSNETMDIILIRKLCNTDFLNSFLPFILKLNESYKIEPNNFIICNFIKFLNIPNQIESLYEQSIPNTIKKILNNTFYINSFYQWFGYINYTLYNLIYCDNRLHILNWHDTLNHLSQYLNNPYDERNKFRKIHNYKQLLTHIIDLSDYPYSEYNNDNNDNKGIIKIYNTLYQKIY